MLMLEMYKSLHAEAIDRLRLQTMFRNADASDSQYSSVDIAVAEASSPVVSVIAGDSREAVAELVLDYWLSEEAFLRELADLIQVLPYPRVCITFFHDCMNILTRYAKDYQEPLLLERWFPRADHDLLFGGVEEVYEFHKVLYQFIDSVLQSNVLDWKLGNSLLDFVCFSPHLVY